MKRKLDIDQIITRTIVGPPHFLLENRIYNTTSFALMAASLVVAITAFLAHSAIAISLTFVLFFLTFFMFFYFARFLGKYRTTKPFYLITSFLFVDISWFWGISESSAVDYLFLLILVLNLMIFSVRAGFTVVLAALLNLLVVDWIAHRFPPLVFGEGTTSEIPFLFYNHAFLMILMVLLGVVVVYFKINYERERQVASKRYRQLENSHAALDHRNEHLESMARMVSHNLRSPAAGMKMLLQLYDQVPAGPERDDLITNFREGAHTLFQMVDDLAAVMMDYRELTKKAEKLLLSDVLEKVKAQLAPQIEESGALIQADFSGKPVVHYSRAFLESIFLNMMANALKYSQKGKPPQIEMRSYVDGGRVMLSFADRGIGIDLKRHGDKLFKMYNTFHGNDEIDSRGIGLFMTKNQVETLGGKISVESEMGEGTTFFIELYRL